VRFGVTWGVVALLYLAPKMVLAEVARLPFQLALAIRFATAVATHFTLQRLFVWEHDERFALLFHHQVRRYLTVTMVQYATTAAATAVYVATAVAVAPSNFIAFRASVFHPTVAAKARS
jgi:putative flippase GtrA